MNGIIDCDKAQGERYAYGKVLPNRKQAVRYMWRARAVAAAGYLLAAGFAALWLLGR